MFNLSSMLWDLLLLASFTKSWGWIPYLPKCPRNQRTKTPLTILVGTWGGANPTNHVSKAFCCSCCWKPEYLGVFVVVVTVQIPPSTTYAVTPMKRPMEEDGEEKSPSKKKKKIQKKGIELTRGRYKWLPESCSQAEAGGRLRKNSCECLVLGDAVNRGYRACEFKKKNKTVTL